MQVTFVDKTKCCTTFSQFISMCNTKPTYIILPSLLIHCRFYAMRSLRKAAKQRAMGKYEINLLNFALSDTCRGVLMCIITSVHTDHTMGNGAKRWLALAQKMTTLLLS